MADNEPAVPGTTLQQILLMERDGTLPDYAKAQLDEMRAAGAAPPAIPVPKAAPAAPRTLAGDVVEAGTGIGRFAGEVGRTGALPMAGGLVGLGLGTAAAPLLGPAAAAGPFLGEALGSGGGEVLNQLFGITEPSLTQIGIATGAGPAGRAVSKGGAAFLNWAAPRAPGAAPLMHGLAAQGARELPDIVKPAIPSETLWEPLNHLNPRIVTTNLDNELRAIVKQLERSAWPGGRDLIKKAEATRAVIAKHQNDMPFQELDATRKMIGPLTDSKNALERQVGDRLYAAIERDYDAFATLPGAPPQIVGMLRDARRATLEEKMSERMTEIVRTRIGTENVQHGDRINSGSLLKALRDDKMLRENMTPDQLKLTAEAVNRMKGLPAYPPQRGVQHGAGPNMLKAMLGGGAASAYDPSLAMTGMALGVGVPWALGKLVSTSVGQEALKKMLAAKSGPVSEAALVALANQVFAQAADRPPAGPVRMQRPLPR